MIRQLMIFTLSIAATLSSAHADHFYYAPRPVVAVPVVAYQPAYVVPTVSYAVTHYPITTVSYTTSYYAPLVPVSTYYAPVAVAPVVYSPPVYAVPVYTTPFVGGYHRVRSRLNVHRHGGYNYHLRVR